jgi:glycine dehydrogenase subunit 1
LRRVASAAHANTQQLVAQLTAIPSVRLAFERPRFHEAVLQLDAPVATVLHALEAQGITGGFDLTHLYPQLGNALLVCATETKTAADLQKFAEQLARIMGRQHTPPPCPIKPNF